MSDLSYPEPVRREQALDVQHDTDPAEDHGIAKRIPHIGHALLFFALTGVCMLGIMIVLFITLHVGPASPKPQQLTVGAVSMVLGYLATLIVSFPLFPMLWRHSFLDGIHWTFRQARLHWWKLVLAGVVLSVIAQFGDHFVKSPKDSDIVLLLQNRTAAWITAIVGGLFIPIYEEIAFRGFLLPALATAYDWLSLAKTPAAQQQWQQTTNHTRGAWIFATGLTSVLFVAIHAKQLHGSPGALAMLVLPALAFCWVRIRYRSVAAAALVHMAYDSLIFLELILSTGGFRHLEKLTSM